MSFKQKVYNQCLQQLDEKIEFLQQTLTDLRYSAANETKSTAGDKHETALAMLQIEQENSNRQLKELLLQKSALNKINPTLTPVAITHGSLIKTNKGMFFISTALGKVVVEKYTIMALSPKAPLAIKLMGLGVHDQVEINGNQYLIETIE